MNREQKNKNLPFKIFALQIVFGAVFFSFPIHTSADGLSITVSPSTLEIEAKPPAEIWAPFTIQNQSSQAISLQPIYKPFDTENSSDGTVAFLKNGQPISGPDKNIFSKIQIVDANGTLLHTISLGPKQQKTFRIHIVLPANEPTSDYYFTLLLLTSNQQNNQNQSDVNVEDQQSFSTLQEGIGLNILLAIGGKEQSQVSINDFSTNSFYDNGPAMFHLSLFNGGDHFISPKGQIVIKNMFGQVVGKIIIPPTVILAGTSRTLFSKDSDQNAKASMTDNSSLEKDDSLQLIWPSSFLLGVYNAQLSLSTSDEDTTYMRNVQFFAFPIKIVILIVIVILSLYGIFLKVKRKI